MKIQDAGMVIEEQPLKVAEAMKYGKIWLNLLS